MADITQAASTIFSHQAHTHVITDVSHAGSEVDVRSFLSGMVYIYHANIEVTANATGVKYIIQGRWPTGASVNEDWIDLLTFQTGTTAAVAAEIAGSEAVGQTQITVDSDPTGDFTRGIQCYIEDKSVVADGEWARVDHSVAATDVFIVDGLTVAKDATDTMWTQAETFAAYLNLEGLSYIRGLMLHAAATGSNIHFKAELVAATDIE